MRSLLVAALAVVFIQQAGARTLRAIDGDTFIVNGKEHVRVVGMDAPELHTPACESERALAVKAWGQLSALLAPPARVTLHRAKRKDKYGRTLARVIVNGADVARLMIAAGMARPYGGGKRAPWCA